MDVKSTGLIVNKAPGGKIAKAIMEEIKAGLELLGVVPLDENIVEYDASGEPLINMH